MQRISSTSPRSSFDSVATSASEAPLLPVDDSSALSARPGKAAPEKTSRKRGIRMPWSSPPVDEMTPAAKSKALKTAVEKGDVRAVAELLVAQADPNFVRGQRAPVHMVPARNRDEIVRLLFNPPEAMIGHVLRGDPLLPAGVKHGGDTPAHFYARADAAAILKVQSKPGDGDLPEAIVPMLRRQNPEADLGLTTNLGFVTPMDITEDARDKVNESPATSLGGSAKARNATALRALTHTLGMNRGTVNLNMMRDQFAATNRETDASLARMLRKR